jgi:hypothetical protein
MVIGFKERFKEPILNKSKIHIIRLDPDGRWKAGRIMHMATGVRTKQYNQFAEYVCVSTQQFEVIRIGDYVDESYVLVDGRMLDDDEIEKLAYNDGFKSLIEFYWWFADGFKGKIIHWTDLKY